MATNGIDATIAGLVIALIGAVGKIVYDWQKAKTDAEAQKATAHAQEVDAQSKVVAVERTAEGKWQETLLSSLGKSNETANEWMQRYGDVLKEVGTLQAQVATLAGQVGSLQHEVEELRSDKAKAVDLWEASRRDAIELKAKLALADAEIAHLRLERDEYKRAHAASMTLFEGMANEKYDPALSMTAGDVVKEVIKYDRRTEEPKNEEKL